eukprot:CAMPEP_0201870566 /NCGR_PEP_ID=MMETSP0902-20130614/3647_1 /ASSEMBLY_ACC=CAM_ASM_000551 /TAXON_ID=420261 /ORGANISM="Thalassiosira antarctica, Strain CCMP982" /LENGTH=109 /DNA_ID=CAMNT_0048396225 /DNA_START=224 /DNA_END=554 /DNA_ORIENTATION=+
MLELSAKLQLPRRKSETTCVHSDISSLEDHGQFKEEGVLPGPMKVEDLFVQAKKQAREEVISGGKKPSLSYPKSTQTFRNSDAEDEGENEKEEDSKVVDAASVNTRRGL